MIMKSLGYLRRKTFWFSDQVLNQNELKTNYDSIMGVLEAKDTNTSYEAITENLDRLLLHATGTTEFYKDLKGCRLSDFPIINKNVINDNNGKFRSTLYANSQLHKASSSGSTGIPFSVLQDSIKRTRNTADVIYFSKQGGIDIGNKLIFIKLWDHNNNKSKWLQFFQNVLPHNVMDSGRQEMDTLVSSIKKIREKKSIIGYPSFLLELCNHLEIKKVSAEDLGISSIITISESLEKSERNRISSSFNAPVYERYSNEENGILAQQTAESGDDYVVNWGSYFIEILELDSDKHVESGNLGRVVVTDLFNFAMPMIRYDTGDLAVYKKIGKNLPVLTKIHGRRMDMIYDSKGEIVSPFIFYRVLDFSKTKQFQFIQEGKKEYLFKLNGEPSGTNELKAIQFFRDYLGADATIRFEYVKEIPLLSSGKRKKVINETI